jgi:protein TonB
MSGQPASHRRNRHLLPALACVALLTACQQGAQPPQSAPPAPTQPMAQETPPPDYPIELACRQIGGITLLNVSLAANGYAVKVDIVASSGNPTLDEAAVAAVREWKFRPATVRGLPTTSKVQVPVRFTPPNPPPDECNQYL